METTKCDLCARELHPGDWPFCGGNPDKHGPFRQLRGESVSYPFKTRHFNGKEIEVRSAGHEKELMKQYGVVKRDDVAWTEKIYEGYDPRNKKQIYREGSGMGLPGVWV